MNPSRPDCATKQTRASLGNRAEKTHNAQASLDFDAYVKAGRYNDDDLIRSTITASIRRCAKSREQIAEHMSVALQARVTAKMLNTYSASAMQANRLPAAWLRAFCAAVGDDSLIEAIATAAGYRTIRGEEIEMLELGRQYLLRKRASEGMELLEKRLAEVEL